MKVTVQYYDKDPKKTQDAVAKVVAGKNLAIETVSADFQTVEVGDSLAAKALMKELAPVPNIQTQTA